MADSIVFEVSGKFAACWPSGKGKEVGSVYGSARSISDRLKQPFIFSEGHLFAFISLNDFGVCMIHTEASADGFLPKRLSKVPQRFFETESLYSLYVDEGHANRSFPVNELKDLLDESRIDIFQNGSQIRN